MTLERSEQFEADLQRQFRWYLVETELAPQPALELAERFAEVVDDALEVLARNPGSGRPRFRTFLELPGIRSWPLGQPFNRFLIFYRMEGSTLLAERLVEGHSRIAGDR